MGVSAPHRRAKRLPSPPPPDPGSGRSPELYKVEVFIPIQKPTIDKRFRASAKQHNKGAYIKHRLNVDLKRYYSDHCINDRCELNMKVIGAKNLQTHPMLSGAGIKGATVRVQSHFRN